MTNKKKYQESRFGITVRLAKKDEMIKSDHFSLEQWDALRALQPHLGNSSLVQMALLHYSKILPDLLIAEQEKELERLRSLKTTLFTTD